MGLYGPDQPEDEVCRAVAAEDTLLRHTLDPAQRRPQGTAEGIGVAVGQRQSVPDGLRHPFGQAEGADVRRKIQRVAAKAFAVAHPVTAVDQLFHPKNPRIAHPHASANPLATYIIRSARRISSGSMGRSGSPMVGFG